MIVEIRRASRGDPVDAYIQDLDYRVEEYEHEIAGTVDTAVLVECETIDDVLNDLDYDRFVVRKPNGYDIDSDWIVTVYDYYIE